MISSSPVEIKECTISNVQLVHPLRGTASAERRRPDQAVGSLGRLQLDVAVVNPHAVAPAVGGGEDGQFANAPYQPRFELKIAVDQPGVRNCETGYRRGPSDP
jgi:hypothetical protein